MEKLYTKKEVADYLQVTERSVQSYIDSGKLKARKIVGIVRIAESELKAFVKANK